MVYDVPYIILTFPFPYGSDAQEQPCLAHATSANALRQLRGDGELLSLSCGQLVMHNKRSNAYYHF